MTNDAISTWRKPRWERPQPGTQEWSPRGSTPPKVTMAFLPSRKRGSDGLLHPHRCNGLSRPIFPLLILIPWFLVEPPHAAGQSRTPVVISVGTHALTTPWYLRPVTDRVNPAFMIGTDHSIRSGDSWRFFYAVSLGFFRHHWWMTGVSIEPELGIGRSFAGGLQTDLRLGLGYMHYFWRRETLKLENGRYVEATDWGKPSLILPLSVTLGYGGSSGDPLSVSPFVSVRWAAQGLFLDEVPVMTHLFLLGGVRIQGDPEDTSGGR